jgi:serine/threonine-protein kinase
MTSGRASTHEHLGVAQRHNRRDHDHTANLEYRFDGGRSRVGRYHLIERVGQGKQGEVWKAIPIEPPVELVAMKLLLHGRRGDHASLARFRREAERGARLANPGILPVYEFGQDGGAVFFVMPLVDGFTLSDILDQRRDYRAGRPPLHLHRLAVLPQSQYTNAMVRVLARVARALDDAHAARVVHCDVKPANILLGRKDERQVYLIDFGMGRDLDAMPRSRTGGAGTVLYMAPEKLLCREVDETLCDVFALGATAYEALTLGPPRIVPQGMPRQLWAGYLARREPPRARTILPQLPKELDQILMRALARDPDRRYASARLMAEDLESLLSIASARPCKGDCA